MKSFALSSGSSANCFYVEEKEDKILIDCGLSFVKTVDFLNEKLIDINDITGIFITHEHSDHIAGFEMLYKNLRCNFYLTRGTFDFLKKKFVSLDFSSRIIFVKNHEVVSFDFLNVFVVSKPHDANEPVSFIVDCRGEKIGFFTDLGHVPSEIKLLMKECSILYIEANYCDDIISIKKEEFHGNYVSRLVSDLGHLSINQTCDVLVDIAVNDMKIILCHISENTNTYSNSYNKIKNYLGKNNLFPEIFVSFQKSNSDWF